MSSNDFEIAVLSYNHPQITERCIRSVLKYRSSLILVHNGSRPENIIHLRSLFPNIHHEIIASNCGYSGGANQAIKVALARSGRVLFLTNDCELVNEPVAPEVDGLVATLVYRRRIGDVDSIGALLNLKTGVPQHLRLISELPADRKNRSRRHEISATQAIALKKSDLRFYVPGSAFWIDRNSFLRLGGFDEKLGTYFEDIELSLRAAKRNVPLCFDPRTEILHRIGKTCHKDSHYTSYLYQRNRFIVCWTYLSKGRWIFLSKYLCSMLRLMARKARAAQWLSFHQLKDAVIDGWKMRAALTMDSTPPPFNLAEGREPQTFQLS